MPEQANRDYVGLEVSKSQLDFAISETKTGSLPYTPQAVAQWIKQLSRLKRPCVICESTGGYQQRVVDALLAAKIEVCVVMSARVRAFAEAEGQLAKTDRIDAQLLRRFGEGMRPRRQRTTAAAAVELRALLDYRRLLVAQLAELASRKDVARDALSDLLVQHEALLNQALEATDARIASHIKRHRALHRRSERMQLLQGVGPVLAATLLAHVPELGKLEDREVSALVGVAPHAKDSGTIQRPRHIRGGRGIVRRVLYMSAACAARFNPILRTFYKRLRDAGKPPKVAIVAVMRKLLCVLNRLMRDPDFVLAA